MTAIDERALEAAEDAFHSSEGTLKDAFRSFITAYQAAETDAGAVAAEREACAKTAENCWVMGSEWRSSIAAAIRSRSTP